jgi:hypothetical protein
MGHRGGRDASELVNVPQTYTAPCGAGVVVASTGCGPMNLGRLDGRMRPSPHGPHIGSETRRPPLSDFAVAPLGFWSRPLDLFDRIRFRWKLFEWVYDLQAIDVAGVLHVFGEE